VYQVGINKGMYKGVISYLQEYQPFH